MQEQARQQSVPADRSGYRRIGLTALLFLAVFAITVCILYQQQRAATIREAEKRMELFMKKRQALFDFVEYRQKPVIYRLEEQGVLTKDFFDPNILSFTYIARNIHELYQRDALKNHETPFFYKLAATNPRNEANRATAHEAVILEKFRKNKLRHFSEMTTLDGERYFVSYTPLKPTGQSCLRCHGDPAQAPADLLRRYGDKAGFHERLGEIRAMIVLGTPLSAIEQEAFSRFIRTSLVLLSVFALFFTMMALLIRKEARLKTSDRINRELIDKLQDSLNKVQQLEGLLPICSSCKQIRDEQGHWNTIEKYISAHSKARFSHSICPECARKIYPEYFSDSPSSGDRQK